jgi:GNAT superfamily N-acetyltransferase
MPESALSVRRFEPGDQDAARSLILQGLGEHFGFIDETLNRDLDDIATTYGSSTFLVAERDGAIVGTGVLTVGEAGVARVSRMSTASGERRSGVGTTVLSALIDEARKASCSRLALSTNADWDDAIAFYRAAGFVETARTEHAFGVGVDFELALGEAAAHEAAMMPESKT